MLPALLHQVIFHRRSFQFSLHRSDIVCAFVLFSLLDFIRVPLPQSWPCSHNSVRIRRR
jgi:hypothetical protein